MNASIKKPIIFISGTDTGVGKTTVSALLLRYLRKREIDCGYQKWVATGDETTATDLVRIQNFAGIETSRTRVDYLFPFPASPHLAADTAGDKIDPSVLVKSSREMAAALDLLIIEGAGGLMVPITRETLLIDLIKRLSCPVLLVAKSGLGTINHSLLSLAALRERNLVCAGIIFCDEAKGLNEKITADNLKTIAAFGKAEVIGRITRQENDTGMTKEFAPLGENLRDILKRILSV